MALDWREPILADTPVGKLWLYEHDLIGMTLKAGNFWDGDFLLPLFNQVKPSEIVINIGAYTGHEAIYLAEKRGARVLAVEANLELFSLLIRNLSQHALYEPRVYPVGYAAYDHPGNFGLLPDQIEAGHVWDRGNVGSLSFIPTVGGDVGGGPLDPYVERFFPLNSWNTVSLIECDAQGADLRALEGLEGTIRRHRPVIAFEYESTLALIHGDTWRDYQRFFSRHRYNLERSKTHPDCWVGRPR